MTAVVDASVLVAALTDSGDLGAWAERVLEDHPLLAPELVLVEATNVLRRLERAGQLSTLEAGAAAADLCDLPIDLVPFPPFADRVWDLRATITSYDAWYVAIAEGFDAPLATLDRRLAGAPGPRCEFLTPA